MGYQSARILVADDVADSLGIIQIWPTHQEEEQFRYYQGLAWSTWALAFLGCVFVDRPCTLYRATVIAH